MAGVTIRSSLLFRAPTIPPEEIKFSEEPKILKHFSRASTVEDEMEDTT